MFESKLKNEQPHTKKITYDISDLFAFIDQLTDLATLTSDTHTHAHSNQAHEQQKEKAHRSANKKYHV